MKIDKEKVFELLKENFENKNITKCIFSNMKGDYEYTKIIIKPLIIKNNFVYQFEQFKNNKAYHSNLTVEESIQKLSTIIENFYQYVVFTTEADIQIIRGKKDFNKLKNVDLIFSLHACNNATDYSLLKGLELDAKAILAVPCCQHEFNQKMSQNKKSEFFAFENPIGKHGILLEKFASLATDALRAQALELCGYKTQVMEFIDMEHTPKNILIRGIKENPNKNTLEKKLQEYEVYKKFLGIEPLLDTLLKPYFKI